MYLKEREREMDCAFGQLSRRVYGTESTERLNQRGPWLHGHYRREIPTEAEGRYSPRYWVAVAGCMAVAVASSFSLVRGLVSTLEKRVGYSPGRRTTTELGGA